MNSSPLLNIITEEDFRNDESARKAAVDFFNSEAGQKYAKALRGSDPMTALSTAHNQAPTLIRDTVNASKGNADTLLGLCTGYRCCQMTMDRLLMPIAEKMPKTTETASARTTRIMTATPSPSSSKPRKK